MQDIHGLDGCPCFLCFVMTESLYFIFVFHLVYASFFIILFIPVQLFGRFSFFFFVNFLSPVEADAHIPFIHLMIVLLIELYFFGFAVFFYLE